MRRTCFSLYVVMLLTVISASGQHLPRPILSTYIGMGAYSVIHSDVFSFSINQASLAQLESAAAGIFSERRFFLEELNHYTAVAALPTKSGNFGLKAGYYGFGGYNETQLGVAYARKLGNKIDLGVQFNYNGIRMTGYGTAAAASFEIGALLHITQKLQAGFHINNPVAGKFGVDQQEKLPSVYTCGLGYDASEKFFVIAEIVKEEDQPVNVNAGFQYKFLSRVLAKAGVSANTSSVWFGIGLIVKTFRVDVMSAYHPQLGITPGIVLMLPITNKEN